MNTGLPLLIATALVIAGPTQSLAKERSRADREAGVARVRVNDIDLSTEAGSKVLLRRIYTAAHEVCGGEPPFTQVEMLRIHNRCVADAVDRALAGFHSPTLLALNDGLRSRTSFIQ